jgi:small subunit ribosomal protein S20
MANIKGGRAARKRDRQNAKANKRNSLAKTKLHDTHKKLFKAADAGSREEAEKKFKELVSGLDKAAKKGIITKNTANRKKSRAQLRLNKMAAAGAPAEAK